MRGAVKTARAIAAELRAEMKNQTSNEATFKGEHIVIKCAAGHRQCWSHLQDA